MSLQTVNTNILIAKFDGMTIGKDKTFKYERNGSQWAAEGLKYDKSWEWLMPVVEKIVRTKIGDGVETVEYPYLRTFGMINAETGQIMVRLNGFQCFNADTLLEATYMAVVDFVESRGPGQQKKRYT